jgi:hypothetical protein
VIASDPQQVRHASSQQGWEEISELERRLQKIVDELGKEAQSVATARQINEFCSDRKKIALAEAVDMVLAQNGEMSFALAESRARALPSYKERLKELAGQSLKAETAIANWQVLQARLDCTRSILSTRRELSRL